MKRNSKIKWTALVLILCLVCTMPVVAFGAQQKTVNVTVDVMRYDSAAQEVLDLVNAERNAYGLRPLTLDSDLQNDAMLRAAEGVVYFAHTRPDGSGCWTAGSGYMAGENLAVGQTSPEMVVDAWMNSDLHRANILHEEYNSIGIGCVNYKGTWFWSQAFARTEGNNRIEAEAAECQLEIAVLTDLVEPVWMGPDQIGLTAEEESSPLKIQLGSVNPGWEYMTYDLDPQLFELESSNEDVLQVDEEGNLTPVSVGTSVITATMKADPDRQIKKEIRVAYSLNADDITLSRTSYTYNGKAKKPTVTVEGLTEADYVVSYKNNVKVGTATVTITGVGDVIGTVTKTFKINYDRPGQVSLKKPTTGKTHYVKARWYDEDCDGYQIRYATNSSFKNSKSIYVKDGDQLTRTIKKLTKGKRYYVKVRAYNNYLDTKVFGAWSKWKSVVCK